MDDSDGSIRLKLERAVSECSDFDVSDLLSAFSNRVVNTCEHHEENDENKLSCNTANCHEQRPQISLRERRRSRVQGMPLNVCGLPNLSLVTASGNVQLQPSPAPSKKTAVWRRAFTKAIASGDPWSAEGFDAITPEIATRYRFDTRHRKWVVDQVFVKMQEKPFGRGAMRQCFRLKKKSNFATRSHDFSTASNCVAKSYLDPAVTRQTYFDDVYLQMDAKYWAERFNLNDPDPPKKIDLIQVAILEFTHRPGSPLFHLEHYIEGEYIKYNSNSGFIDMHARMTPQAFSHFTFERSGRRLMVVDVQGVGDLYTDPQIHTAYTSDMYTADEAPPYGDGNLGIRGMALFFYSHQCNQICSLLGLSPFTHASHEFSNVTHRLRSLSSGVSPNAQPQLSVNGAESPIGATVVRHRNNTRSGSCSSDDALGDSTSPLLSSAAAALSGVTPNSGIFPIREDERVEENRNAAVVRQRYRSSASVSSTHTGDTDGCVDEQSEDGDKHETRRARIRVESQMLPEDAGAVLAGIVDPLDADMERHPRTLTPDEILALVHLDFARCYDSGRFAAVDQVLLAAAGATPIDSVIRRTSEKQHDHALEGKKKQGDIASVGEVRLGRDECESALVHLEEAAKLGNRDAIQLLSRVYLNLDRDLLNCLNEASFGKELYDFKKGLSYMTKAAQFDIDAALFLGQLYETGHQPICPLSTCSVECSVYSSIEHYAKALELYEADEESEHSMPIYEVHAKLAALYASEEVGDYSQAYDYYSAAAASATAAMKGKLASRYYQLAEEVSALIEE